MKIKVCVETGFAGCIHEDEFECDDDATDEEIEEMARDVGLNYIGIGWWKDEN